MPEGDSFTEEEAKDAVESEARNSQWGVYPVDKPYWQPVGSPIVFLEIVGSILTSLDDPMTEEFSKMGITNCDAVKRALSEPGTGISTTEWLERLLRENIVRFGEST